MKEFKITITCPECGRKLAFPLLKKKIRFSCPTENCNHQFEAMEGKITKNYQASDYDLENTIEGILNENIAADPSVRTWKILTSIFALGFVAILISIVVLSSTIRDRNRLTKMALSKLKTEDIDYEGIKSIITPKTQYLLEAFVENQYATGDSLTITELDSFRKSLTAMEYGLHRKFYFLNTDADTLYFYVEFVDSKKGSLLHVIPEELFSIWK